MRRSELLGLSWDDVRRDGTLTVRSSLSDAGGRLPRNPPKGRRPRTVKVDRETMFQLERHRLWEALKVRRGDPGWRPVLTDPEGMPLWPSRVTHVFRVLVRRSGLPVIRFHDPRHTHATLLLAVGVPAFVVRARLGHSAKTTFIYYSHVLPSTDSAAAVSYARLLRGGRRHTAQHAAEDTAALHRAQLSQMRKTAARKSRSAQRMNRVEVNGWR